MNAQAFADLLRARSTGTGRWAARCPAHQDRLPSLSIRESEGRTLLHCFAGCRTEQILARLGLGMVDLFDGPPPSPEQSAALRAEREAREREAQAAQAARRNAWAAVRRWQAVVNALGSQLARKPDGVAADTLGTLFHRACWKLHAAEGAALAAEQSGSES